MIYLNSGSHSITPPQILDAVQRHQREYEQNPTLNLFLAWERLWRVQERVAAFFHADARDLMLRPNVTEVLNEFILGAPLPPNSEIAITDLEYGAILNLVRFRCERDGLTQRSVHLPGSAEEIRKLTPDSLVSLILSQLSPSTKMLVCSDIMTHNGLVVPIALLGKETRKRGILLVIDGAHGPGSLDLDFRKLGDVDFYGGNLHKWMLGPKGTSFGWVNPLHQESLNPIQAGWTTFEKPPVFAGFGGESRFAEKMLMVGCRDFAPFYALEELISYWENEGPEKIRARIYSLQSEFEEQFASLGLPPVSPARGPLRGPLLSYEIPEAARGDSLGLFFDLVRNRGLQVMFPIMQGRPVLRVSPHVYNTSEQISRAVGILRDAFAKYSS